MTTGIQIIQAHMVPETFPDFPSELNPYVAHSNPLFAGYYHSLPFCVVGIVPQQQSGTAGIWGWNTSLVEAHPYIYGRYAHRLLERVRTCYPKIVGACAQDKMAWIASLGATFPSTPSNGLIPFVIEASQ